MDTGEREVVDSVLSEISAACNGLPSPNNQVDK